LALAYPHQNWKDRITQQWSILIGRRYEPTDEPWLAGPFGSTGGKCIGEGFIAELAQREHLVVTRNAEPGGLIPSISQLRLPPAQLGRLAPEVADFYEHTGRYNLTIKVTWQPLFRRFGTLVNLLFSRRLNQLNVPTENSVEPQAVNSEIITLNDPKTGETRYTIWYRTELATGRVIYSGIYGTCTLPDGRTCVRAVFPLPRGNATVIFAPEVGDDGSLVLSSSGRRFGDPGFYFLLRDADDRCWANHVSSFRDRLVVSPGAAGLRAEQSMRLLGMNVVKFIYGISEG